MCRKTGKWPWLQIFANKIRHRQQKEWGGRGGAEVGLKKAKIKRTRKKTKNRKANMILRNKVTTDHDNQDTTTIMMMMMKSPPSLDVARNKQQQHIFATFAEAKKKKIRKAAKE